MQSHKDKNKIQAGGAINKQLQQRANDATSQMYPPEVGNQHPTSSAKTRYTTKTALKTRMSAATHTTTPPGTVANACHTRAIRLAAGKC